MTKGTSTMNEVALPQIPGKGLATNSPLGAPLDSLPQTASVIQLGEWAAELAAAHSIAQALASSSFLPMGLRKKDKVNFKNFEELTNDAAAVILAGKSVGLDPMQSVQNIFPVHGMPSMYARTMGALVIAQGHDVLRTTATNDAVTYKVRRKGQDWQEFTWTIDRAKKAGYTSNEKYTKDPIAMLGAKALAEACRVVFPDILLGMAYSVEEIELEDMGEQPATSSVRQAMATAQPPAAPAPAAAPRKSSVARAQQQAAQAPAAVAAPQVEDNQPVEMISAEQGTHLQVALKAAGFKTSPQQGTAINEQLNRQTSGPQDITAQEAEDLIEFFNTAAGAPAALDTAPGFTPEQDADWLAGATA